MLLPVRLLEGAHIHDAATARHCGRSRWVLLQEQVKRFYLKTTGGTKIYCFCPM